MPTFVGAKCPNCGGDLQVPSDRTSVKCMYCSGDVIVKQAIMSAATGNVQNWMKLAKAAVDAGNYEETLTNANKVLEVEPTNHAAWLFKAVGSGWLSNLRNCRLEEMVSNMKQAIECAPRDDEKDVKVFAAEKLEEAAAAYYLLSRKHFLEFVTVDGAWPEFLEQANAALTALDAAHNIDPQNAGVIRDGVKLMTELIQGVAYNDTDHYGHPIRRVHRVAAQFSQRLTELKAQYETKLKGLDPSYQTQDVKVAKVGVAYKVLPVLRLFNRLLKHYS